jgi:hypothetical protein
MQGIFFYLVSLFPFVYLCPVTFCNIHPNLTEEKMSHFRISDVMPHRNRAFSPIPQNKIAPYLLNDSDLFKHCKRRVSWQALSDQERKQSSFHSERNVFSSPSYLFPHPGKGCTWNGKCLECDAHMMRGSLKLCPYELTKQGNAKSFFLSQSFRCSFCQYGITCIRIVNK